MGFIGGSVDEYCHTFQTCVEFWMYWIWSSILLPESCLEQKLLPKTSKKSIHMSYMNVGFTTCLQYDTCYLQYWSIGKINGFTMHYWCIIYLHPNVLYWTFCRGHNSILFSFSISLFSPVLYYFLSYPYLSAVIPDIMLTICMLFLCSSTEFALFLCLSKVYFIICSPFKTENHD